MHTYGDDDSKWQAVATRDKAADGAFFSAVRTVGVFCRPSCPGRPLRRNVVFYGTAREALRAGYRPCQRCRPTG
jgi:methylphosphotriester-DNA--protein-cysteine methyltransferase